jgi:hypothetical protein
MDPDLRRLVELRDRLRHLRDVNGIGLLQSYLTEHSWLIFQLNIRGAGAGGKEMSNEDARMAELCLQLASSNSQLSLIMRESVNTNMYPIISYEQARQVSDVAYEIADEDVPSEDLHEWLDRILMKSRKAGML